MDELMTIPADRFQVLNAVRSAMGAVLAVMNLQMTARAAPRAAPTVLLHGLTAMDEIDTIYQRLECYEISAPDGFDDQFVTIESTYRAHASLGRQFANLVAG